MLGRAVGMHWLALVRDVLALGYRSDDIFICIKDRGRMRQDIFFLPVGTLHNDFHALHRFTGFQRDRHRASRERNIPAIGRKYFP